MKLFLVGIYIMNLIDLFNTRVLVNLGLATEANPFMDILIDTVYMDLYKIFLYPLLLIILKWIYDQYPKHKKIVFQLSSVFFVIYSILMVYQLYGYYINFL